MSVSDLMGRREPVTKERMPGIWDLTSVNRINLLPYFEKARKHTSSGQKRLDTQISFTHTHDGDACAFVNLNMVIPDIAKQFFD